MKYTYIETLEQQIEQGYRDLPRAVKKGHFEEVRVHSIIFKAREKYHALTGREYVNGFRYETKPQEVQR